MPKSILLILFVFASNALAGELADWLRVETYDKQDEAEVAKPAPGVQEPKSVQTCKKYLMTRVGFFTREVQKGDIIFEDNKFKEVIFTVASSPHRGERELTRVYANLLTDSLKKTETHLEDFSVTTHREPGKIDMFYVVGRRERDADGRKEIATTFGSPESMPDEAFQVEVGHAVYLLNQKGGFVVENASPDRMIVRKLSNSNRYNPEGKQLTIPLGNWSSPEVQIFGYIPRPFAREASVVR